MPPTTWAASIRGERPAFISEEIRSAFSDAPSQGSRARGTGAEDREVGAPQGSAMVTGIVPPHSGMEMVQDRGQDSRQAPVQGSLREIRTVAETSEADRPVPATRSEMDYNAKFDRLTARLLQLQEGQRELSTVAVEVESAIGSVTSEIHALGSKIASLELAQNRQSRPENPLPPPHQQRGHEQAMQGSANNLAPSRLPPNNFSSGIVAPPPGAPPSPIIPLDARVARFEAAPTVGAAKLVTTATSSAPLLGGANLLSHPAQTGPFAPVLEPLQTMLPPFARVVDYRRYRLDNTSSVPEVSELRHLYRLKTQIDGLYPTLGSYDGAKPVELLSFLITLKEAFNAYGTSEAVAVRALAYFLAKEAKDVYQAQVNPGALDTRNALDATWPYVVNALIRRFLSDDILQGAYVAVVRASQGPSEDEVKYAQRISDAARECCHVFQQMELVNSYVRGLHEATRERVQEQVKRLSIKERSDLVTVRQDAPANVLHGSASTSRGHATPISAYDANVHIIVL